MERVRKAEGQVKGLEEQLREVKQQLMAAKQSEEQAKIALEEKLMEVNSTESELKTMRELYSELQKEIDRRKVNLTSQMEE